MPRFDRLRGSLAIRPAGPRYRRRERSVRSARKRRRLSRQRRRCERGVDGPRSCAAPTTSAGQSFRRRARISADAYSALGSPPPAKTTTATMPSASPAPSVPFRWRPPASAHAGRRGRRAGVRSITILARARSPLHWRLRVAFWFEAPLRPLPGRAVRLPPWREPTRAPKSTGSPSCSGGVAQSEYPASFSACGSRPALPTICGYATVKHSMTRDCPERAPPNSA